ncbi:MAG: hypothetical protein ACI4HL_07640 [Ruminococcus sp.]
MKITEQIKEFSQKNSLVNTIFHNRRHRIVFFATTSLAVNICYAIYNGVLGVVCGSLWFLTMFAYYTILSVMRFNAVIYERKSVLKKTEKPEIFVMRFTGIMLMVLSFVLSGSVYYSNFYDVATKNGKFVMITIATYTFYKVTIAIVNAVKTAKHRSPLLTTIRNIGCADAVVSIMSLQRSMLVSFKGMNQKEIMVMNTLTGIAVCLFVFIFGLVMATGKIGGNKNGKIKTNQSKRKNSKKGDQRF